MQATQAYQTPATSLHLEEARWFVCFTSFKREKSAFERLRRVGIEAYVPLIKQTKRYQRKVKTTEIPLINNYVFVKITKSDYVKVLRERDIAGFLQIGGQLTGVSDHEIDVLKRVVGDHEVEITYSDPKELIGKEVEIIHGQMTGIKGRVDGVAGKRKFNVHLDSLGITLKLQVPQEYLAPIH